MIKKIERGAHCQENFYFWSENTGFYGFAYTKEWDNLEPRTINLVMKSLPPHEIYQETVKFATCAHGFGEKKAALVAEIVDRYRRDNPSHFCECGEPLLHWYKHCPTCGKRIGG